MNLVTPSFAVMGIVCGYVATSTLACETSNCGCPDPRPLVSGEFSARSVTAQPDEVFPTLSDTEIRVEAGRKRVTLTYRDDNDDLVTVRLIESTDEEGGGGAE